MFRPFPEKLQLSREGGHGVRLPHSRVLRRYTRIDHLSRQWPTSGFAPPRALRRAGHTFVLHVAVYLGPGVPLPELDALQVPLQSLLDHLEQRLVLWGHRRRRGLQVPFSYLPSAPQPYNSSLVNTSTFLCGEKRG